MRVLESTMFFFAILYTVIFIIGNKKTVKKGMALPIISFLFLVFHIAFEGTRWQLIPLYILIGTMGIVMMLNLKGNMENVNYKKKVIMRKIIGCIMVFFVVFSAVAAYTFPIYKIPNPNGEYKIGTETYDLVDSERAAVYSDDLSQNRKIKIQIWYPSDNVSGYRNVPWLQDGKKIARALAKDLELPEFLFEHTELVKSNSYEGAPISNNEEKYPLVIISHGWGGFRNLHTDWGEELASKGYIAVSIDHTYGSQVTVFKDGSVEKINRLALPKREENPEFLDYGEKLVETYAGDVTLVLNTLLEGRDRNEFDKYRSRIDRSNVGLLGHSTGGGAGVLVGIFDERVKAILGMDAWVEPIRDSIIEEGLEVPTLFLRSSQWEQGPNNRNLFLLIEQNSRQVELFQMNGVKHTDFSMVYMYSPLSKYLNITGKLDGRKSSSIQREFVSIFFDKHLKGLNNLEIDEIENRWNEVYRIE